MPIIVPAAGPVGTLEFKWIDPQSVERDLTRDTSPNLFVPSGSVGLGNARFELASSKQPLYYGDIILNINTEARTMEIPIVIYEDNINDAILAAESLHGWFDTGDENQKTPGYFKVIRPDASIRQILAYYIEGLEGDTSVGSPNFIQYTVKLFCPDPYPTEPDATIVTKTVAQAAAFSVINQGKRNTYPVWTITGPFSDIAIVNSTTGETMNGSIALTNLETLVVDSRPSEIRPGFSIYKLPSGTSLLGSLTPASKFWQMVPGQNNMAVIFGSGTTSGTTVQLSYLARYRSLMR